ncbi:hypothetical protein P3S68_029559 [Capsicum galapagoense]
MTMYHLQVVQHITLFKDMKDNTFLVQLHIVDSSRMSKFDMLLDATNNRIPLFTLSLHVRCKLSWKFWRCRSRLKPKGCEDEAFLC